MPSFTKDDRKRAGEISLEKVLEAKQQGEAITYEEIAAATGDGDRRYHQFVRTFFAVKGWTTTSQPKRGWMIDLPDDQVRTAQRRKRKGDRQHARAHREVARADRSRMSPTMVRLADVLMKQSAEHMLLADREDLEVRAVLGAPKPLPRLSP